MLPRVITCGATIVCALLAGSAASAHVRFAYAAEFACAAPMSEPGEPSRTCTAQIVKGNWHIDLNAAYGFRGAFTLRVEIPDGRYISETCSTDTDPVAGESTTSCSITFAGLGDESGGSIGLVDGAAYLHVHLPSAGTVTLTGGEGRGVVAVRGARNA